MLSCEVQHILQKTSTHLQPRFPHLPVLHPPQVRSGERRRASEAELVKMEDKVLRMEAEREAVLTSMGEELDAACRSLAQNGEDKLQVLVFNSIMISAALNDADKPHHVCTPSDTARS